MEARVKISPETLKYNKTLTAGKRTQLRKQNIIDLINSKPSGTPITNAQFAKVTAHRFANGAGSIVTQMVKDGILARVQTRPDSKAPYTYTVIGKVKTKKHKHDYPEAPSTPPASQDTGTVHIKSLTEYAVEFAWERNSDSLREFVQWMDGKELNLRRLADKKS